MVLNFGPGLTQGGLDGAVQDFSGYTLASVPLSLTQQSFWEGLREGVFSLTGLLIGYVCASCYLH